MDVSVLQPVLAMAADEAVALGHGYLGPEHLLIATSQRVSPACADVLARHGLTPGALRAGVSAVLGAPVHAPAPTGPPQPTMRARRALERAVEHAVAAGSEPATPDDLLAGLLAADVAPGAVIGTVLERSGVEVLALRREVLGPPGSAPAI